MLILSLKRLEGGELYERIMQKKFFSEQDAAKLLRKIVGAIHYIHSKNIVHRDLKVFSSIFWIFMDHWKPENILITDFGLSKYWDPLKFSLRTICGSPGYVGKYSSSWLTLFSYAITAPEILAGKGYTNTTRVLVVKSIRRVIREK